MLATTLQSLASLRLKDEDGDEQILELQPPATEDELRKVESGIPCPIPDEIRAALRVTKGLANGPLESFSLVDLEGFGLDEMLPHPYSIAHDGFGNYWVLDLLPGTTTWGPVLYACHDPPVLAYQAATVEEFVRDIVAMWQADRKSPVAIVRDDVVHRIWRDNPGLKSPVALRESPDSSLREFAETLPATALVADLREPAQGQGLSWGRFGPRTVIRRAGQARIWAIVPPEPKPGLFSRIFGGRQ